jgi:hypothetical protein
MKNRKRAYRKLDSRGEAFLDPVWVLLIIVCGVVVGIVLTRLFKGTLLNVIAAYVPFAVLGILGIGTLLAAPFVLRGERTGRKPPVALVCILVFCVPPLLAIPVFHHFRWILETEWGGVVPFIGYASIVGAIVQETIRFLLYRPTKETPSDKSE